MKSRAIISLIDDPRVVTVAIAALVSAALWLATWSNMSGMDMASMPMGDDHGAMAMAQSEGHAMAAVGTDAMAGMTKGAEWSAMIIWQTALMWMLMMAAMMLPSMAPIMAVYAGLSVREDRGVRLALRITLFTLGYFLLWALFSIGAAFAQLGLRESQWFTMGGTLAVPMAAAVLLIIAGAYQLSPIKEFCLRHCRHPLTFLLSHWREGLSGAFSVGLRHGLYCFGCCVAFMGLMFVFGAMNIWWMAVIALYFLAEKIAPHAEVWGKLIGLLLIIAGCATLLFESL